MRCGESGCSDEAVGGFYWPGTDAGPKPACARHLAWARQVASTMGMVLHEAPQAVIDAQAVEEARAMFDREREAEKAQAFGAAYGASGVRPIAMTHQRVNVPTYRHQMVTADAADMVVRVVRSEAAHDDLCRDEGKMSAMDGRWLEARTAGTLVRLDTVRAGKAVLTAYNGVQHVEAGEALRGCVRLRAADGTVRTFAGCAEVLELP